MAHARLRVGALTAGFLLAFVAPGAVAPVSALPFTEDELKLIEKGFEIFTSETFAGNGRTCGTCHLPAKNYNIGPADIAELMPAEKALVLASNVPELENATLVEQLGIFNINEEHAPGNMNDPEGPFRASMTIAGLAFSTENEFCTVPDAGLAALTRCGQSAVPEGVNDGSRRIELGWGGDAALIDPSIFPDIPESQDCKAAINQFNANPADLTETLRTFSLAAVKTHFTKSLDRIPGTDFRCPTSDELDALAAFQKWLGRRLELDLMKLSFIKGTNENGPGPGVAEEGKELFIGDLATCNRCHFNAGANDSIGRVLLPETAPPDPPSPPVPGANKNSHTSVDILRIREVILNDLVDPVVIPRDTGDKMLKGGNQADGLRAGGFNVQSLIESPRKRGFFHNNGFTTEVEDAIAFYFTATFDKAQSSARVRNIFRGGRSGPDALAALGGTAALNKLGFFLRALSAVYSLADCERLLSEMILRSGLGLPTDLPAMHCQFALNDVRHVLEGAKVSPVPYSPLLDELASIEAALTSASQQANAFDSTQASATESTEELRDIIERVQILRNSIASTPQLTEPRRTAPVLGTPGSAFLMLVLVALALIALRRRAATRPTRGS